MQRWTVLVGVAGIMGCGGSEIPDDLASKLSKHGGCADVAVVAKNADASLELVFQAPAMLADAYQAGGTLTRSFNLGDQEAKLKLYMGNDLSVACDDVGGDDVDREILAVTGSATLTVNSAQPAAPGSGYAGYSGKASLVLENVVFEDDAGTLPALSVEDVLVGWLAG